MGCNFPLSDSLHHLINPTEAVSDTVWHVSFALSPIAPFFLTFQIWAMVSFADISKTLLSLFGKKLTSHRTIFG